MLHILNLNKTTDKKNSLHINRSATNNIDNPNEESLSANHFEGQCKAAASTSYQGNENELKELTPKKPIKLAPLELSEDIRKTQSEKLKDVQIEAKMAAEKLATSGAICMENQLKKVRNRKQLENLEKIRQAENALLENQKSSKSLRQQASFLPAKISDSIINHKFGEKALPNKLLVPITSIGAKSEMVHDVQNYIPDGNPEPTHQAVRGRLRIKQGKGREGETRGRSKPLKPLPLTFSNVNINEDFNTASQQVGKEVSEATKLLNNGIRRKYIK